MRKNHTSENEEEDQLTSVRGVKCKLEEIFEKMQEAIRQRR